MHSLKKIEKFIELRAANHSFEQIASKIKVSRPTLMSWAKKHQSRIDEETQVRLDSLRRTFYVTEQHRISVLGEHLNSILSEIGKRNLASVSTERLLDLQLKYMAALKLETPSKEAITASQAVLTGEKSLWEFRND